MIECPLSSDLNQAPHLIMNSLKKPAWSKTEHQCHNSKGFKTPSCCTIPCFLLAPFLISLILVWGLSHTQKNTSFLSQVTYLFHCHTRTSPHPSQDEYWPEAADLLSEQYKARGTTAHFVHPSCSPAGPLCQLHSALCFPVSCKLRKETCALY